MTELSHSDAQAHEVKDFYYLFWPRESEQVPVILGLKKYDDCLILVNKSILFKMCIFQNELVIIGHYSQTRSRTEMGLHSSCRVLINIKAVSIHFELKWSFYR